MAAHRAGFSRLEQATGQLVEALVPVWSRGRDQTEPLEYIEVIRDKEALAEAFRTILNPDPTQTRSPTASSQFFRMLDHIREPRVLSTAPRNSPNLFIDFVSSAYRGRNQPRRQLNPYEQALATLA